MGLARSRAVLHSRQDVEPAAIQRRNSAVAFVLAAIAIRFGVRICRHVHRRLSTCRLTANGDLGATTVNAQLHAAEDIDCDCENATIQRHCECHHHMSENNLHNKRRSSTTLEFTICKMHYEFNFFPFSQKWRSRLHRLQH